MTHRTVCSAGITPAIQYTLRALARQGVRLADGPGWHVTDLLLDVPSFRPGALSPQALDTLLASLPREVCIWGGNLDHPGLEGLQTRDLLQDEAYLTENAAITARCTIPIIRQQLPLPWQGMQALVMGWGRIGKALAPLLAARGCQVTVATSDPGKAQSIRLSGVNPVHIGDLSRKLPDFRLIVNTAPCTVLTREDCSRCQECVKIDLASVLGIDAEDVIWARGLPGRLAPEESGKLIADTIVRRWKEETP